MTNDHVEMEEETGQQMEDINSEPFNLKIYCFTHVVFGVSASPFLLNATIWFHLEKHIDTNKTIFKHLLHSIYVISGAKRLSTFMLEQRQSSKKGVSTCRNS